MVVVNSENGENLYKYKFPVISVIVTAYERRQYILDALISLRNQTMDSGMYEVIVVKNFIDGHIDRKIKEFGYMDIIAEGTMGDRLACGIEYSRGHIICFLQDDDLFESGKLETVRRLFTHHEDLCFVHNGYRTIDRSGNLVVVNNNLKYGRDVVFSSEMKLRSMNISFMIKTGWDFNLSCMSIKRCSIYPYLNNLRLIVGSDDSFVFFTSLFARGSVLHYKEWLTRYRVHNSATIRTGRLDLILMKNSETFLKQIKTFELLENMSNNIAITKVLQEGILARRATVNIVAYDQFKMKWSIKDMLKLLVNHNTLRMSYLIKLIFANTIIILNRNIGRKLYYQYTNNKYAPLFTGSSKEAQKSEEKNFGI